MRDSLTWRPCYLVLHTCSNIISSKDLCCTSNTKTQAHKPGAPLLGSIELHPRPPPSSAPPSTPPGPPPMPPTLLVVASNVAPPPRPTCLLPGAPTPLAASAPRYIVMLQLMRTSVPQI